MSQYKTRAQIEQEETERRQIEREAKRIRTANKKQIALILEGLSSDRSLTRFLGEYFKTIPRDKRVYDYEINQGDIRLLILEKIGEGSFGHEGEDRYPIGFWNENICVGNPQRVQRIPFYTARYEFGQYLVRKYGLSSKENYEKFEAVRKHTPKTLAELLLNKGKDIGFASTLSESADRLVKNIEDFYRETYRDTR